jgi:hypothetical protein
VEVLACRSLDMFDEALTEMFWNLGRTFPRGFIFVFLFWNSSQFHTIGSENKRQN